MLHAIIREHLEPFRREVAHGGDGNGLPRFVEHEFRDFLRCGILAEGFYHTVLVGGCGQTLGKMLRGSRSCGATACRPVTAGRCCAAWAGACAC